jgi:hypothetical protein
MAEQLVVFMVRADPEPKNLVIPHFAERPVIVVNTDRTSVRLVRMRLNCSPG